MRPKIHQKSASKLQTVREEIHSQLAMLLVGSDLGPLPLVSSDETSVGIIEWSADIPPDTGGWACAMGPFRVVVPVTLEGERGGAHIAALKRSCHGCCDSWYIEKEKLEIRKMIV